MVAAAGLAIALGGHSGPAQAALGCDLAGVKKWDGGGNTNRWDLATNWEGNVLPASTEHVCISAVGSSADVLITATTTVQSIDSRKPLTLTAGTLTLANAAQESRLAAGFTQSGGILAGASPRTLVAGAFSFTGGSLNGPGATTIPSGVTFALSGTVAKNIGGPVVNQGTLSLDGTGPTTMLAGSRITNSGAINLLNEADLDRSASGSDGSITNLAAGVIAKKTGVESYIEALIENDGTIRSDAGNLRLHNGTEPSTASAGKLATVAGTTVTLDGGTYVYDTGSSLLGAGQTVVASGVLAGPVSVPVGTTLNQTGGTVRGPDTGADFSVAGTYLITGPNAKNIERRIANSGTIRIDGYGFFTNVVRIANSGIFEIVGGSHLDASGTGPLQLINLSTGRVRHTGNAASVAAVELPIENDGVVESLSGGMDLQGGTGATGSSSGSYSTGSGASILFDFGTYNIAPGGKLAGPGIKLDDNATLSGPVDVVSGATLTVTGGALRGPTDSTTARVLNGGAVVINGTLTKSLSGTIENAGLWRYTGSAFHDANFKLTNVVTTGFVEVVDDSHLDRSTGSQILNNGTIKKVGLAASTAIVEVPIDNDGVVQSLAGVMDLQGGTGATGASGGTYSTAAGTQLLFDFGTFNFTSTGKLSGPGLRLDDNAELSGPFQVLNGATLTVLGGTMRGPVDTTTARVLGGGVVAIVDPANKGFHGNFSNAGTWRYAGFAFHEATFNLANAAAGVVEIVDAAHLDRSTGSLIANKGTIKKIGLVDSTASVEVPIDNDGFVRSEAGVLDLSGGTGTGNASTGEYSALTTGAPNLRFAFGTYAFDPGGRIAGPGATTLAAAAIEGPWTIKNGARLAQVDGTLRGPNNGTTALIEASGRLTLSTAATKALAGTIRNLGAVVFQGYVFAGEEMQLVNATNPAGGGGVLEFNGSPHFDCCGTPGPVSIVNEPGALIRKLGPLTTVASVEVPVDNDGLVRAIGGVLELSGGSGDGRASSGEYNASAGGHMVRFSAGSHMMDTGGRFTGPGPIEVGNANVEGPFTVKAGGTLIHRDGNVRGPAVGAATSALVEAGGTYVITSTATKEISGAIRNLGTLRMDGNAFTDGGLDLRNGNLGVVDFAGAPWFDCSVCGPQVLTNEAGGIVKKTGARSSVASIEIGIDNDGTVRSEGGTLDLVGGTGTGHGSTGEYTSSALANTVRFGWGEHAMETGSRITGPGKVVLGNARLAGPLVVKSGGRLVQIDGILEGAIIEGVAPILVEDGGILHVTTATTKSWEGAIRNEGLTLIDGYLATDDKVDFVNASRLQLDGAPWIDCCGGTGPRMFTNLEGAEIVKTGTASSVASVEVPIDNDGVMRAESGIVNLSGGSDTETSTGEYSASAGGPTIRFTFATTRIATPGRITGPGVVTLLGGTLDGPLTIKAGGTLSFGSGDLWAPLSGSERIRVEPGGTLRVISTAGKGFRGPFQNDGTTRIAGPVTFENRVQFTNAGTLELGQAGFVDCCGGFPLLDHLITNTPTGLVRVYGGVPVVEPRFTNLGTVAVDGGKVHFWEPTDFVGGVLSGTGTWNVKTKLGLRSGGLTTNQSALKFDGPGAAIVNIDGVDATGGFTTNGASGRLTIANRTHTLPTFSNRGQLVIGPSAVANIAKLTQVTGSTLVDGTSEIVATNGVDLTGGDLNGTGKITGNLRNVGGSPPVRLLPGGELDIEGTYTQGAAGVLEAELTNAGVGAAQRQLLGSNAGTLGGTLRVSLDETYTPVVGDSFVLGTFAARSGTFSTLTLDSVPGFALEVWYTTTEFGVRVISAA